RPPPATTTCITHVGAAHGCDRGLAVYPGHPEPPPRYGRSHGQLLHWTATSGKVARPRPRPAPPMPDGSTRTHLDPLETERLHILREVAADFRNPVMMYSIGKASSVLLHLLLKAFFPARPPIPLLHVDTNWKFREMIAFRDQRAAETGCRLLVHVNQEG